jgi:class 3 adenylate cyclase
MNIGGWLRNLGLDHHEAAFRENKIDVDVLPALTDQDLKELGVLLGDRRKLLRAIAALDNTSAAASSPTPVPVAAAAPPTSSTLEVSGERRHVTMMFCDLVDLTGIETRVEAEEWRGLVGAYLDAASTAVTEWGGKVSDKLGDGLIALFGYPVAQENDGQRAAHAASAIQRSLAELNRKNHRNDIPILAARIVIDSGPMAIDDAPGRTMHQVLEQGTKPIATDQRTSGPLITEGRSSELKSLPWALRANGLVRARGDGRSMTYHQLISRAVDQLDSNTAEARRTLYDRARHALLNQLRSNKPVLVLADITRERRALDEAISKVEFDAGRKSRTDLQEAGTTAPPGQISDGGATSGPPRLDRTQASSTDLPEDGWPAVLFSARDRLLSVRSSRRRQAASGFRGDFGDVHDVGAPATDAKAPGDAPETYHLMPRYRSAEGRSRSSSEPHPDVEDLLSLDYRARREQSHELDCPDGPGALPAPEVEEEQKDQSSHEHFSRGAVSRPNWSRPLPKLLIISGVMTAATLNDVRVMIERYLPVGSRANEMWRYVSNEIREAALGSDILKFSSILEMALSIEGLECAFK